MTPEQQQARIEELEYELDKSKEWNETLTERLADKVLQIVKLKDELSDYDMEQ